jgi:hypothetical protein
MQRPAPALSSLVSFLVLLALAGCEVGRDQPVIRGSGTAAEEAREVTGFTAVQLAVPAALTVEQAGAESLRLEGDDNVLAAIETSVQGGVLRIQAPGVRLRPERPLRVHLTVRELERVEAAGAASVTLAELSADRLEVSLAGAGRLLAGELEVRHLVVGLAGAGRGTLGGRTDQLELSLAGAGSVDATELAARLVQVQIAGAGNARVHAAERLSGSLAGAASLTYHGDPRVEVSTAGASRVRRADP